MQLRPFPVDLAATVATWATSPKEAAMWCGHTDGPVTAEKVAGWATGDDVQPFGLYDGDDLVGYGEVWADDAEAESELARLIVDPRRRGQGVGRRLVAELTARATHPAVLLRVHPDNHVALRCYAAARFTRVSPAQEAEWNAPQPVPYIWLVQHR